MNKRISFILTIAALAAALTLTSFAQNTGNAEKGPGAKPIIQTDTKLIGTQVKLPCSVNGPSEFPTVNITNVMKCTYVLQQTLYKGSTVKFSEEAKGSGGSPTAWYFK